MVPPLSDLSYLQRLCKGDRAIMETFIQQYLADAPMLFMRLNGAAQEGNIAELALVAHDLRPHAHYMGAHRVLDLLMAIDRCARGEPSVLRDDLIQELMLLVAPLEAELKDALHNGTS